VLDHPNDDDDENDPHENPDPDRYLHLFLLGERQFTLSLRILTKLVSHVA
jgi:hypothetical protein